MTRARQIQAMALLVAIVGSLAIVSSVVAAWSIRGQDATARPAEVGAGPPGDRAFAIVGRTVYQPDGVQLYGYLNAVIGLDPALLFVDAAPAAGSARFTFSAEIPGAQTSVRADLTTIAGEGTLRIFLDDGAGAAWDEPDSFADGQAVAEFALQLQDSVQRQAPSVGVMVGEERLTQLTAGEFSMDGANYRFGSDGIEGRLRLVGAVIGADTAQPLTVDLAGTASVTRRETTPVRLAGPGTPTPPLTTLASKCPTLEPWLGETRQRLAQATALGEGANVSGDLATVDPGAREAAAVGSTLAQSQRQANAPPGVAQANQLAVTALSTLARGLRGISDAASAQDTELLAESQSVLMDGERLLDRARAAIDELSLACPES
jgi:hypothetical protein